MASRERRIYQNNSYFVSFCKSLPKRPINGPKNRNEDRLGFLKPRMWAQYGQRSQGICLAFSRSALEKEIKSKNILCAKCEDVDYLPVDSLAMDDVSSVCTKMEEKGGDYSFDDFFNSRVSTLFFSKHQDYKDENECRLLVADESIEKDYEYLDCKKALRGICYCYDSKNDRVPNLFPPVYISLVEQFAGKYTLPIIEIAWTKRSVKVTSRYPNKEFERCDFFAYPY